MFYCYKITKPVSLPLKLQVMNKRNFTVAVSLAIFLCTCQKSLAQTIVKKGAKYDTIIRKHTTNPPKKKVVKKDPPPPVSADTAKKAVVIPLPVPEFINQPYYFDINSNKLIKLENTSAQMVTKKKTFGLKGAKQSLTMEGVSSRARFSAKKDISFLIKTSGDVIDLTSYIRLYQFIPSEQNREVTINTKEGVLADKEDAKGKLISFSVKSLSPDTYQILLSEEPDAGEYAFVWVKNMELKEFTVFAFGIDWESSN